MSFATKIGVYRSTTNHIYDGKPPAMIPICWNQSRPLQWWLRNPKYTMISPRSGTRCPNPKHRGKRQRDSIPHGHSASMIWGKWTKWRSPSRRNPMWVEEMSQMICKVDKMSLNFQQFHFVFVCRFQEMRWMFEIFCIEPNWVKICCMFFYSGNFKDVHLALPVEWRITQYNKCIIKQNWS